MKNDRNYLLHIQESIEAIERWTVEGKTSFFEDDRTQAAVLRKLQELAESAIRVSPAVKERYPEVEWDGIRAFRHVVVHDYLGINLERIWDIVTSDMVRLKPQVSRILAEL